MYIDICVKLMLSAALFDSIIILIASCVEINKHDIIMSVIIQQVDEIIFALSYLLFFFSASRCILHVAG